MATKKTEPVEETPTLKRLVSEINRKFGANTIGIPSKMQKLEISRIPTGIASLDSALGGGFPMGRLVELYGLPSGGKTLIALLTIKQAQAMGLECVYIDAENTFDPEWAKKVGVNIDKLYVSQLSVGEKVIDLLAKLMAAKPGVMVIDSIAAINTEAEIEESMEKQFMATKARLLSRGIPKLNVLNDNTLILCINQLREIVTTWGGGGTTTPGGMALKFYSSIRMEIKKDKDPITASGRKTDDEVIGQTVLFKVTKNKTAPPFQRGSFKFYYNEARVE